MKKIMEIHDVFELPKVGLVAGGANPELDCLTREQIRRSIPERVLIQTAAGKHIFARVLGVEVVSSLIDQKNIHLRFDDSVQRRDLENGATVYSISGEETSEQLIEQDAVRV